jgi:hypothetical protein
MYRSSLFAAGALLVCGVSAAQTSDGYLIHQGKVRDAGTFHWESKTWTRAPGGNPELFAGPVYDNTCFWTALGANSIVYSAMENCEDIYVTGRIPANDPLSDPDNLIDSFRIGYLTVAPPGGVDIEYEFYDTLGGACSGPYAPPMPAGTLFRLDPGNGVTLPGDPAGTVAVWLVTINTSPGFCMLSDGDATTGNGNDQFTWRYKINNGKPGTAVGGIIIAGEPLNGGFGACTYANPCGTNNGGGPCGTGLGIQDQWWGNLDANFCPGGPGGNTGCYWFGGWPANPYGDFYLQMTSAGPCSAGYVPTFYCTGKTTSETCQPYMDWTGTASATSTGPFRTIGRDVVGGTIGLLIYSNKKGAQPDLHGGKLCVKSPFKRTPGKNAKTPSNGLCPTATGRYVFDFQNRIQGGLDPALTAGRNVFAQFRGRDPADPAGFGDALSNGMKFVILP